MKSIMQIKLVKAEVVENTRLKLDLDDQRCCFGLFR